jgi:hypothetical protein
MDYLDYATTIEAVRDVAGAVSDAYFRAMSNATRLGVRSAEARAGLQIDAILEQVHPGSRSDSFGRPIMALWIEGEKLLLVYAIGPNPELWTGDEYVIVVDMKHAWR